jgi:hypothetical protein
MEIVTGLAIAAALGFVAYAARSIYVIHTKD